MTILDRRFQPVLTRSKEETMTVSSTGGQKGSKLDRYDLIPAEFIDELAKHFGKRGGNGTYGSEKYSENNWRKGYEWGKSFRALMSHAWSFWRGEDIDSNSGTPHIISVAWHACALYIFSTNRYEEFDDRPNRESE